jgi:hypothetical protein
MKRIGSVNLIFFPLMLLFTIIFAALITGATNISYADDPKVTEMANPAPDLKLEIVTLKLEQKIARSGCCSWHGGVCDCIGGRVVCCDGTFSPTCTCHHNSNKIVINSEE